MITSGSFKLRGVDVGEGVGVKVGVEVGNDVGVFVIVGEGIDVGALHIEVFLPELLLQGPRNGASKNRSQ